MASETDTKLARLMEEIGWRLNHVSGRAILSPGGDEATFGSTGDLDMLREAREMVEAWRRENTDAQ